MDIQAKTGYIIAKKLGEQMKYHRENFSGVYDFRCNYHDGWAVEAHLHEYSELLYCKTGVCEISVDGKKNSLSEGELIWLPPNSVHQFHKTDAQLICAVFSRDFIPVYFHLLEEKRIVPAPVKAEELREILDNLPLLKDQSLLLISGYLNLICAKVMEKAVFEENNRLDGALYQKVISYISEHFREDISLKSIARHFGYNEKYLSHTLHSLTGIHFSKLLSLYRIEYAQKLLREQMITVSQVAAESGFSAINTFNRAFKETVGKCPLEYRKASRK